MSRLALRTFVTLTALLVPSAAFGSFHFMQIEQIIGGVNGDPTAQAVQLRMRLSGQGQVQFGRLVAHDAAGNNPVVLATFSGPVPNGTGRVLIASSSFASYTSPAAVADKIMSAVIPASYLAAGSLTWEDSSGVTIYWRVSWGGASYTGSGAGSTTNDSDGNFNPPIASALPSSNLFAVKFTGAASAQSTNNAADYALTTSAAVFTNNAPASFTVTTPPCSTTPGDMNGDTVINGADIAKFVNCAVNNTPGVVGCTCSDQDHNGILDSSDINAFVTQLLS
ncbi:MAG TPA: hypothetical protein VMV81_02310 [Phycisphaerae bacterium]|nr:hypothetical protein [Phycisphaerae bacterium]